MSENPRPRRPSRAVYRRRRLVVGALALVLLAGVVVGLVFGIRWLVAAQPWQNLPFLSSDTSAVEEVPDPVPTLLPTEEAEPAATPSAEDEPEECANGALQVSAVTDQESYAAGENPQISLELTNVGSVDCVLNVGTSQQRFEIVSGSDTWWRSTDCQSGSADQWVTLAAGQTVSSTSPITWDRTRSATDTCDAEDRPAAVGGGATYALTVRLGEVMSQSTSFLLY
ncbi:hypothetical protein [Microbacterium sp. ZXX196]|uniref:hypothetical protein n=1 Tax=Microbacterium sp. ZXX196 TaxID=2609291 RepID=UPI00132841B4|nr:hypothetical protein [Microbacterium sp. ZXX196]MTE24881.1 hypothetical protein [Microbacterium sp. ZXX196]